jgi:predicted MFS family arabinose efflux permease
VTWNCAISGGGVIGGILLNRLGVAFFPWILTPLLIVSFVIAAKTKRL